MADFFIRHVEATEDLADTIKLFEAYVHTLGIDLTFQDFATEMASMPGKYSPPTGALFLARSVTGEPIGCVGVRPLAADGACEMKRLYVNPKGRGTGVGRALARTAIAEARRLGYQDMRLDTLSHMISARALYQSLGFLEIKPYYVTPLLEDTIFLQLRLDNMAAVSA